MKQLGGGPRPLCGSQTGKSLPRTVAGGAAVAKVSGDTCGGLIRQASCGRLAAVATRPCVLMEYVLIVSRQKKRSENWNKKLQQHPAASSHRPASSSQPTLSCFGSGRTRWPPLSSPIVIRPRWAGIALSILIIYGERLTPGAAAGSRRCS